MHKITTLMLPVPVHIQLKKVAKQQGTSMSWLVVESLLQNPAFGMTQDELNTIKEVVLPKTFKERKEDKSWKQVKKG